MTTQFAIDSLLLIIVTMLSFWCACQTTQIRRLQTKVELLHGWSRSYADKTVEFGTVLNRFERQSTGHYTIDDAPQENYVECMQGLLNPDQIDCNVTSELEIALSERHRKIYEKYVRPYE